MQRSPTGLGEKKSQKTFVLLVISDVDADNDDDDDDEWLRAAAGLRITTSPPSTRWRQIRAVIGHRWKNIAKVKKKHHNAANRFLVLVMVMGIASGY